ncbi:unnamed protein product [Schistosoma rodhaini]|uniref:Corticotropin-releasing factor domain-containing protein n=1 Tax=Schistosoma rodhaini TaxID=6188 RepID=A0AA85GA68_9TREM|nr:unnamed protein product [Schistosoma rodhaini]
MKHWCLYVLAAIFIINVKAEPTETEYSANTENERNVNVQTRQERAKIEHFRRMFILNSIAHASKRSDVQIPRISIFVNETAEAIKAEKRRKDAREDRINYLKHVIGNLDRRGNATTSGTNEKTDG